MNKSQEDLYKRFKEKIFKEPEALLLFPEVMSTTMFCKCLKKKGIPQKFQK